ncbi:MAG: hypothetical protein ACLTE8_04815 [Christensenellales bacterium]
MDNDWNRLADLIANLITKYAGVLDLDNLPDPTPAKNQEMKNSFDMAKNKFRRTNKSVIIYLK